MKALRLACTFALASALLAPAASADWEAVHRFLASDERSILDYAVGANGTLHIAAMHRSQFLVYDTNASGNWTSTYVQERDIVGSVALAKLNGTWGVVYAVPLRQETSKHAEGGKTMFATSANRTVVKRVLASEALEWSFARRFNDTLHLLARPSGTGNWSFIELSHRGVASRIDVGVGGGALAGFTLLADGSAFGVTWGRDGAIAMHAKNTTLDKANATRVAKGLIPDPRVAKTVLDRFWDYRGATVAIAKNGTALVFLVRGAKVCDTFWVPADLSAPPKAGRIEPCASEDETPSALLLGAGKPIAVLQGRLMPLGSPPSPLECVSGFSRPTYAPDGRLLVVGGGTSIFRDRGEPRLNASRLPRASFTGFATRFNVDVDDAASFTGLRVDWNFGDGGTGASGLAVNRTFYKPGNYTIRASVTWEGCGVTPVVAEHTLKVDGPAVTPPKAPSRAAKATNLTDELADSPASGIPGPGAALALLALVGAALVARRRQRS